MRLYIEDIEKKLKDLIFSDLGTERQQRGHVHKSVTKKIFF